MLALTPGRILEQVDVTVNVELLSVLIIIFVSQDVSDQGVGEALFPVVCYVYVQTD